MARFNIENMKEQSKVFYGIPSPAAAGVIMLLDTREQVDRAKSDLPDDADEPKVSERC